MSNNFEREEAERFEAWAESVGVNYCPDCGSLYRDWDLHLDFHKRLADTAGSAVIKP